MQSVYGACKVAADLSADCACLFVCLLLLLLLLLLLSPLPALSSLLAMMCSWAQQQRSELRQQATHQQLSLSGMTASLNRTC
jgi:hypothetical protein